MMKTEDKILRESVSSVNEPQLIKTSIITTVSGYTVPSVPQRRVVEVPMDPEKRPSFANIQDDYHLLENLLRYSKFCENFNVPVPQMAQSLARAIGIQNGGKYSVIVYDYLLAIPEYPPTQNGRKEVLQGEGRFCNMVCYKSQLFGVVVFPSSENVTFYFTEFSCYNAYVQQLVFTYGNKILRYCSEKRALAFEFKAEQQITPLQSHPILLTATVQRTTKHEAGSPSEAAQNETKTDIKIQRKEPTEYIQLE